MLRLINKIKSKSAVVGVVGLGYVGLPLALTISENRFKVIGFDVDDKKIPILNGGKSYIKHISQTRIKKNIKSGKFIATTDFSLLNTCNVIIICVPTPLNENSEPDLTYVVNTAKIIQHYLKKGQLIILESTTYPGTTDEILLPLFEHAPFVQNEKIISSVRQYKVGKDFFLAFSPEREDPNNKKYRTSNIPKIVGGITKNCLEVACIFYDQFIIKTVPVSSTRAAEAVKLLENIYRSVNIALVNELKMIYEKMGIDIWEVIEAAKTKPFGYHPFYPGPGLGGHCIPIDPFYLSWKAKEYNVYTKFIELAGEINTFQPYYVVQRAIEILIQAGKVPKECRLLILGAGYKKNVDDTRESPLFKLVEILQDKGIKVDYSDPFIPVLPKTRKYNFEMKSVPLTKNNLNKYDMVILSTDHDIFDYKYILKNSNIILDTRNVFRKRGLTSSKIKFA